MANYLDKEDLYFQTVISKGKGTPTKKLDEMFYLIAVGMSEKFSYRTDLDIQEDQRQEAYVALRERWTTVRPDKVNSVFPFYSEIAKRACTQTYNHIVLNVRNNGSANTALFRYIKYPLSDYSC